MREYVGYVTSVSVETFTLAYRDQAKDKILRARLISPSARIIVGKKVKIFGDWAGNLGADALTTFAVQEVEALD